MGAARVLDDERGFSLAEVLIAIIIVSVGFAAILTAMTTSITVSDLHRKQATADALVRSAAEALKDTSSTDAAAYVPCATPASYAAALPPAPAGYSVSISSVTYWQIADPMAVPATQGAFQTTCSPDRGLELITVVAASSDGKAVEQIQLMKRRTP
jgi:prepilin-type N-terminal cleavage/methylation domain-containing protein